MLPQGKRRRSRFVKMVDRATLLLVAGSGRPGLSDGPWGWRTEGRQPTFLHPGGWPVHVATHLRQALWPLNVAAAVAGVLLCLVLLSRHGDTFGRAWVGTASQARSGMAALFGAQATIFSVGLSLTMLALQNAATQYSARLLELYVRFPQIRWVIAFFAFSVAFDLVAVWALGLEDPMVHRARPVMGVAFLLLFIGAGLLPYQVLATIRSLGPETILAALAETAREASTHLAAKRARLRLEGELEPPPPGARPLVSPRSGYVIDFDIDRAISVAAADGLRVWFEPRLGAWVEAGERIGWVEGDDERSHGNLAECLLVSVTRSPRYDVAFRLRLLRDVGVKALSPGINEPTIARLALHQVRLVLRLLPGIGGRWVVADRAGVPRLAVEILDEAECLSIALEGFVRYGAGDPEVLEEVVLAIQDVGTRNPKLRAPALLALRRVGKDAEAALDPGRAGIVARAIGRAEGAIETGESAENHQPIGGLLYS